MPGCKRADRRDSLAEPPALFRECAAETGLEFRHFTGATGEYYMPEIMGSGVALLDYDGDGDLDVFLVQGAMLDPSKPLSAALFPLPAHQKPGNRLFRNELIPSGELRFTDVTEQAGLAHVGYGMGAAVGDYDNDGHPDLYVTEFGHNHLYHNNGDGTFTDVTRRAGVDDERWSTSAAFVDYDRDGFLDLFVLNYVDFTVKGNKRCYSPTGELDYCTPVMYNPVTARLFHNERNGTFRDVTGSSGIGAALGPGLGVACDDLNQDGWTDIYVANDTAANLLWLNRHNGTFQEVGLSSGVAYSEDGIPKAGMGVSAADYDGDGWDDLWITNLTREGGTLFHNDGNGSFSDDSARSRLSSATFPYTGFGTAFFDYDNDGWPDLFVANGAVIIEEALRGTRYPFQQPNLLLHNENGRGFADVSRNAGPAFSLSEVSRGASFGDIDNDGDIDIVVTNNSGPVRLLLNQQHTRNAWLTVTLEGVRSNREGIGARIGVLRRGQKPLWALAHTDGSYLSASDPRVHFGLGENAVIERVIVEWPSGAKEFWTGIKPNSFVTLKEGTGHAER